MMSAILVGITYNGPHTDFSSVYSEGSQTYRNVMINDSLLLELNDNSTLTEERVFSEECISDNE